VAALSPGVSRAEERAEEDPRVARANAVKLMNQRQIDRALLAADRAVELAPDWSEAYFVRAGVRTAMVRKLVKLPVPARVELGVPYARAAELAEGAASDLRRYLELAGSPSNQDAARRAEAYLRRSADRLNEHAETVAGWKRAPGTVELRIRCGGRNAKQATITIDGKRVVDGRLAKYDAGSIHATPVTIGELRPGRRTIVVRAPGCASVESELDVPVHDGTTRPTPLYQVDLAASPWPPPPTERQLGLGVTAAFERLFPDDGFDYLSEIAGGRWGADLAPGAQFDGIRLLVTAWELGKSIPIAFTFAPAYYRGSGGVTSYTPRPFPPPGSPTAPPYEGPPVKVDLRGYQYTTGARAHIPLPYFRLFAGAAIGLDWWTISDQFPSETQISFRMPLQVGLEIVPTCGARLTGWAQYGLGAGTFSAWSVAGGVQFSWCPKATRWGPSESTIKKEGR
jgi:hypothetical protein